VTLVLEANASHATLSLSAGSVFNTDKVDESTRQALRARGYATAVRQGEAATVLRVEGISSQKPEEFQKLQTDVVDIALNRKWTLLAVTAATKVHHTYFFSCPEALSPAPTPLSLSPGLSPGASPSNAATEQRDQHGFIKMLSLNELTPDTDAAAAARPKPAAQSEGTAAGGAAKDPAADPSHPSFVKMLSLTELTTDEAAADAPPTADAPPPAAKGDKPSGDTPGFVKMLDLDDLTTDQAAAAKAPAPAAPLASPTRLATQPAAPIKKLSLGELGF